MFVWFSIGFFLSLAFQGSADLPYAAVADVFWVPSGGASDGDEGLCLMDEAGDFFLDGDDELVTIRGFESILCLDLLGIPCVVFRGKKCVDSVLTHDVGVSG